MAQPMSPRAMPRSLAMSGSATFTAEMSRMTISCATASRTSRDQGDPAAAGSMARTVVHEAPIDNSDSNV